MILTVARADLQSVLALVARVVERRNTIPVLGNVLLTAAGGKLAVRGTDLDIEARGLCPADVTVGGDITVPAALLTDIVRRAPEGCTLSLEMNETRLTVKAGRARFTLQTLPASDFPDLNAGPEMLARFTLPAAQLAEMFGRTLFAVSTEETRYYLNGVHWHVASGDAAAGQPLLIAVATDGHRLARTHVPLPPGAEAMPGVIVPRKAVAELIRMAETVGGDIAIAVNASKLTATAGGTRLVTKLIDATFPDYARVIPQPGARRITIDAAALVGVVDRVAAISSERGRAVKFEVEDGRAVVSVNNPDTGEARDEIDAALEGGPLTIGFNARYVTDLMAVARDAGAEAIHLHAADSGSPALVLTEAAPELTLVLMPMRV